MRTTFRPGRARIPFILACSLLALVVGCGDDGPTEVVNEDPTATITSPADGATFVESSEVELQGSGNDPEDGALTGTALTWSSDRDGALGTGASVTVDDLSVGAHVITLTATDADGAAADASVTLTVTANQTPSATITAPANGATYTSGENISFEGSGTDPEDGALTGESLAWASDLDGSLGTGAAFETSSLSVGTHTIELVATDSHGAADTASIGVEVTEAEPAPLLAAAVSPGGVHTCVVTDAGAAMCWGLNMSGALGNGSRSNSPVLEPVTVEGGHEWAMLDAGSWQTTCGVTTGGEAYCWGEGINGQLGNGADTTSHSPVQVAGGHSWAMVSVARQHACGVTTAGDAYCWGMGDDGQLGTGTSAVGYTELEPALVAGGHTWSSISAAGEDGFGARTCGLTTAGDAYCWGDGSHGENGTGEQADYDAPTLVTGGYDWAQVDAGMDHTCGVTTTGDGYCWGYGADGELGTGFMSNESSPAAVSGDWSWTEITAGSYRHSCGVSTTGQGYCWGLGHDGQLGTGEDQTIWGLPLPVTGDLDLAGIEAGYKMSCGITTAGVVWCWGANSAGQLGDGTTVDRNGPVMVVAPR